MRCSACGRSIELTPSGRWKDRLDGDWNEDRYGDDHDGHTPEDDE